MRTNDDVERYLKESDMAYQDYGDGLFVVSDEAIGVRNLAIKVEPPVVVFRLRAGRVPAEGTPGREALFQRLLELNGQGLLHSSFALMKDSVYLTAALPLDNLDLNELRAVVEDMGLAVSQHLPGLNLHADN
jgi:hypothetical protein